MNRRKFLKYLGLGSFGGAIFAKSVLAGPMPGNTTPSSFINVKGFGAVGDGVKDDTTAIQAAIDSGKGPVFIGPGVWVVSQIQLPPGMLLMGVGCAPRKVNVPHFGTRLLQKPGTNLSLIVPKSSIPPNEWWHWVQIRDLNLAGDLNATAGCGIEATRRTGENFKIENVQTTGFAESGIRLTKGSTPGSIENCSAFGNAEYGFDLQRTKKDVWNQFTVRTISGDNNGVALVRIKTYGSGEDQITISNVKAECSKIGTQQEVILIDTAYGGLISIKNISIKPLKPMNSAIKIINAPARLIVENFRCQGTMPYWIDDTNNEASKLTRGTGTTAALVSGYWDNKGEGQTKVITHPAS